MSKIERVAILSPGEMGAAIGDVLYKSGVDVLTCLEGRSSLSRVRAFDAHIRDTASYDDLVIEADVILSVVPPRDAAQIAGRVADALKRTKARVTYVDCNTVSPATACRIAGIIQDEGSDFIDGGIIGGPPSGRDSATRFYCSGPDTAAFEALRQYGLDVRVVGHEVGQASGLNMVYAASTKATAALWTELLAAAKALGLQDALTTELESSRVAAQVMRDIPVMPRHARHSVAEMDEVAATFSDVGLTPRILKGAADMYRLIESTPLGTRTCRDKRPTVDQVLEAALEAAG